MPNFENNSINFSNYLADSNKEYTFKVKVAALDMTTEQINKIFEKFFYAMEKYGLVSSKEKLAKTPILQHPLDFPNVKNSEVYTAEFVCKYPASRDALKVYLAGVAGISEQLIAVYSENDPRETTTAQHLERTGEDFKKDYVPVLDTSVEQKWPEEAPYGDEYNVDFLKNLQKKSKEHDMVVVTNSLIPEQNVDKSTHKGDEKGKQNNVSPLTKIKLPPKFQR